MPGEGWPFERLAKVAGAQRRLARAARPFGASEALRETIGVAPTASGRAAYKFSGEDDRAAIRAHMGDDAFGVAQAEGWAIMLSVDTKQM